MIWDSINYKLSSTWTYSRAAPVQFMKQAALQWVVTPEEQKQCDGCWHKAFTLRHFLTLSRTKNSKTLLKDGGNRRAYVTAILKKRAWKRRSRTLMRGFWFMLGFRILLGPMLLLLLLRGMLLLLAWFSDMVSVSGYSALTADSRSAWLLSNRHSEGELWPQIRAWRGFTCWWTRRLLTLGQKSTEAGQSHKLQ